jgi:Domain of unknown function (DUF4124)
MKVLSIVYVCLLSLTISSSLLAQKAKIFTWTDEQGNVHYGEHPPKNTKATRVNPRVGHSEPVPVASTASTSSEKSTNETVQQPAVREKNKENCEIARKNLKMLNSGVRMKIAGDDGVQRFMTEDDKAKQRDAMQAIVEQDC